MAQRSGNKYARVFALLKQVNTNGLSLTYQEAVSTLTGGRTSSLSELSAFEVQELERQLQAMTGKQHNTVVMSEYDAQLEEEKDKMRKAIISAFKSIGRDVAAAKSWAEKYGVNGVKRKFNDYTKSELFLLIRNANNVKADFIKASSAKR